MLCDCLAKCKGGKYISPATYYRHAKFRDRSSWFSARLQHIFAINLIIYGALSNALEGSSFSSGVGVPSTATSNSIPWTEQTHGPVDDSHHKGTSVCAFGIGVLGKTDIWFQASEPSPPSTSGLSSNDISPSGPLDESPGNWDDINPFAPGSLDTENLHGSLNSYNPRHGDNSKD